MNRQRFSIRSSWRRGYTLIEMLIVIAAMLIIAGLVIPQFQDAVRDAKKSATLANLQGLTGAIERYKLHHEGFPPDIMTSNTLIQLTSNTDYYGDVGTGAEFSYGPYILAGIPVNPLNGDGNIYETQTVPPADLKQQTGWIYDPVTGHIWAGEKLQ